MKWRFGFSDASYWILVFPIVWGAIPAITYRFKTIVAFSFVCLWVLVHLLRGFRRNPINISLHAAFVPALVFLVIHLFLRDLYFFFGHGMHSEYHELATNLMIIIWLIVLHWSIMERRFSDLACLVWLMMACTFIAGIYAVRGMNAGFVDSARGMMINDSNRDNLEVLYDINDMRQMGLGGFGMMYGCAVGAALFVKAMLSVETKKIKFAFLACILACILAIKGGGLGTPIVLAFFGMMLSCVSKATGRHRNILGFITFLAMTGFIAFAFDPTLFSPFSSLFKMIGENMSEGAVRDRVLSAAEAFSGDKGQYALARAEFQMRSLFGFFKSPFLGNGFYRMSADAAGHSFILDQLSYGGIVAMIPFVLFLVFIFRYFALIGKYYYGNAWMSLPVIYISVAMLAGLMNPVFLFSSNFFILMPGIGAILYEKQWRQAISSFVYYPYARRW